MTIDLLPKEICKRCKGTGQVDKKTKRYVENQDKKDTVTCPACKGSGLVPELP